MNFNPYDILNHMNDPVCVIDTTRTIQYCNKEFSRMVKLPADEIIGKSCDIILHSVSSSACFTDNCCLKKAERLKISFKKERCTHIEYNNISYEIFVSPVIENGQITGIIETFRDISHQKNLEKFLGEKEEKYRDLIETASDMIIIIAPNGFVGYFNPAFSEITGYSLTDTIDIPLYDMVIESRRAEFLEKFNALKSGERIPKFETVIKNKNDTESWVEISLNCQFTDDEPTVIRGILRDVTERIEYEQKQQKLITELTDAIESIKTLQGLIPICASCKKIRDDKGYWHQVEQYVQKHSNATFSHGICPECAEKYYKDYLPKKEQ